MDRRGLLKVVLLGGAALALGAVELSDCAPRPGSDGAARPLQPTVWYLLEPGGDVVVYLARAEMGQGVTSTLPMLVAEELDVDWSRVAVRQAPLTPAFGPQSTTASLSVFTAWDRLRPAGAAGREMLVSAAALRWGVDPRRCSTARGEVRGPGSRRLSYGDLTEAAARLPVPEAPRLKSPTAWRLIGRTVPRPDIPAKVRGSAVFGADVRLPGMAYAAIAHCPYPRGSLVRLDASGEDGAVRVVPLESAVAVVAESYWVAEQAARRLKIEWRRPAGGPVDSGEIARTLAAALDRRAISLLRRGSAADVIRHSAHRHTASYSAGFLAHACMEPVNCTARVTAARCEVWAPTQSPTKVQAVVARHLGRDLSDVTVHATFVGGGFGRKSDTDFVVEAVEVSRAVGRPVQLTWSREEDIAHDRYRPAAAQRLSAAIDADGRVSAWQHAIAVPSVRAWWSPAAEPEPLDGISVAGADAVPYEIPHLDIRARMHETGVPLGILRGIGHGYTVFARESFVDELALAAGRDPLAFRLAMLPGSSRARRVLTVAAEHAGWATPSPPGTARGIALSTEDHGDGFAVYIAQVAEVSLDDQSQPRVDRVVCAVDVGRVVNRDGALAQVEGGVIFGLTAALHGTITLADGVVQQSNFHDYRLVRMDEAPRVEVHLVESDAHPAGLGEKAVPAVAPAVANALFALTGQRLRALPMRLEA